MPLNLKPSHKSVEAYYKSLAKFEQLGITHETAVRSAFQELLGHCAQQFGWKLVPEYKIKRKGRNPLSADGALIDDYGLNHGVWEAKDAGDDLEKEIKTKFAVGYPKENILFQAPTRAVLYQHGERFYEADLQKPDDLIHILDLFLSYAPPAIADWEKAVEEFKERVPEIGKSLGKLIEKERKTGNKKFIAAFNDFLGLCRASLNPNLSEAAVEEMIIQHMLTERIFRKIFDVADFTSRNVIAQEIEKVIGALTSRSFSRDDFVQKLDHFYIAIEGAAATIHDFSEKQTFLNTVYERFFQGFSVKVADTHGVVYTPQPLVNFMVASVEHILKTEFQKSLGDKDVHILDPFTGTGNFIVNIMRHIPKSMLPHKYANELHCNEVMLLPYYVASMNIEHEYYEATGKYEPFEGICLVDTFQTAEDGNATFEFFNEQNSARVERQKRSPIRVVLANPPYNAGQQDENDDNKNRKYIEMDRRVKVTYVADSKATLRNSLSDPYIKSFRYATDRIGDAGVVCYVTNNGFIDGIACDGVRKHLADEFDLIYVLDLGGNVRKNPSLSGTTHNVFGIQVGVSITILVKLPTAIKARRKSKIYFHSVPKDWRREEKYKFLEKNDSCAGVNWTALRPDAKNNWLSYGHSSEFATFLPLGSKEAKRLSSIPTVFRTFTNGAKSNSDEYVYKFQEKTMHSQAKAMIENYSSELNRWISKGKPSNLEEFLKVDTRILKWIRHTKKQLLRGHEVKFRPDRIRRGIYRPFCEQFYYFEPTFNEDLYQLPEILPTVETENENQLLCVNQTQEKPFTAITTNKIPNLVMAGGFGSLTQCFPLFTYSDDGKERRDNVPRQTMDYFRIFYDDEFVSRKAIFHYVYAVLHHPAYRTRYAENLKRELPRIPFVGVNSGEKEVRFFPLSAVEKMQGKAKPEHNPKASARLFHAFAAAGKKLADLHINYESAREFPLKRVENKEVPLDWRVEKMKLTPDKSALIYNDFLTLERIPPAVFDYRLGNRSALDWIIDQYRVERDEKGEITSDPNRDDEEYIVRLIGQVITVSLETLTAVAALPPIKFD